MELSKQSPTPQQPNIILQMEEGLSKFDGFCVICYRDIPEYTLHHRRLYCKCEYHTQCIIREIIHCGIEQDGDFHCRRCLRMDEDYHGDEDRDFRADD